MKKQKKQSENYLDYVPAKNGKFKWNVNDKNLVVVHVPNVGLHNKIAQKFFKKPKVSHIELDELGSFVWNYINGNNNIYNISEAMKDHFGKEAEPIFNRLIEFFKILYDNKFIVYLGKENK